LVDYLLRRGKYDLLSLAEKRGGLYWRNGGVNWKALVSLAAGMFGAMMWIDALYYVPSYTGPLSNGTHGADFSWLFGMIIAGVVYWVLSMTSVPKEARASSSRLDVPVS
jgi:NCS1 family nucleobase:cation symporter-1